MDVSFLQSNGAALTCDYCNYPRRGLPPEALCPECGNEPPMRACTSSKVARFTRNQQVQFRFACIGLLILMIASFYALRVCIVMDGEALAAINVPSPKVSGVVLVQREVGGAPGEWGVLGWMSCLWSIIGIWMITARRSAFRQPNLWASSRQITRWMSLILTAGLAGYLLSDLNDYIPLHGRYTDGLLLVALIGVEIPVNFFLFRYLRKLASLARQPRLARWLGNLAWFGAIARCIQLLLLIPGNQVWQSLDYWRIITGVAESMIAIPIGVASWCAVLMLTGVLMKIGFENTGRRAVVLARDRTGLMKRLIRVGEKHLYRLLLSAGLAGWMLMSIQVYSEHLTVDQLEVDSLSNSPALAFPGPHVSAMMYWYAQPYDHGPVISRSLMTEMFVLMLLTTAIPGQSRSESRLRFTLRWVSVVVIGMTTHVLSQVSFGWRHPGVCSVLISFFIDAFSTFAMYWYLSGAARSLGHKQIATRLKRLAAIIPILIVAPRAFLFTRTRVADVKIDTALISATISAANLIVMLICLQVLSRFIYALIKPIWQPANIPANSTVN